jgi:hypothetical protein
LNDDSSWLTFFSQVIKKAYHKAVLVYHPDKAQHKSADGKKEDRSVFLKVQEAFNVLSNETKRRAYDSQMPFDESTPTEERVAKALEKGPKKFFKLYDAVFKRNARFAVKKPVPEIGGEDTPMAEVRTVWGHGIEQIYSKMIDKYSRTTGISPATVLLPNHIMLLSGLSFLRILDQL